MGPTCTKSQVKIVQEAQGLSGTSAVGTFDIFNTSKSRCSLQGTPILLLVGSLGPLKTNQTNGSVAGQPALPANEVTLSAKGGQASFEASWAPRGAATPASASCPDGNEVQVTLPGVTGGIITSAFITACGGDINVSPIQPNLAIAK